MNARSTEEKWKIMYKTLFPADSEADIPSPYDRNTVSPNLARALTEALEEELNQELAQYLEPVVTRIKARIPAIIERCRANLAQRATATREDINVEVFSTRSKAMPEVISNTEQLHLKDISSHMTPCVNGGYELPAQAAMADSEKGRQQSRRFPTHGLTPSGSSTGSEQIATASPSTSTDNIAHTDILHNSPCSDPNANIGTHETWNMYESTSFPLHPEFSSTLLDCNIPARWPGFEEQDPALRPYHNNPYLCGGSESFDEQDWNGMAAVNKQYTAEYPAVLDRTPHEEHDHTQTTQWETAERSPDLYR
ncbi:hypothetical protein SLS60_004142 [Paraconiothyrium brasiliense]|uniref:Uncharacterized protein n=1 Tax=Paraconiothyrium brasiliense TaxID=300254 RepID=A0ABR3RQN4_9PLEO